MRAWLRGKTKLSCLKFYSYIENAENFGKEINRKGSENVTLGKTTEESDISSMKTYF